jgi:integrase/recombinase XerD
MKVSRMLDEFCLSKRAEGVSPQSITWYRSIVGSFDEWLAWQESKELTPATMKRYLVHLRNRHNEPARARLFPRKQPKRLSDHSIQSIRRGLSSFFNWCVAEEGIPLDTSPMVGVKVKKPEAKEPRRALRSEVDALIRSIPVDDWQGLRDYLIVHVIFYCGLRVGELIKLEAHHFDVEQQILHVPAGKSGAGVVPLVRDVIEAFLAYQTNRPQVQTDKLFVSSYGTGGPRQTPITTSGVRTAIQRRCEEAGIRRLNPHAFRHGIAMHLLNDKRSDSTLVQRLLRHSSLGITTKYYARWTDSDFADAYREIMQDD